jgi:Domain of unknown function (DUF3883)
MPVVRPFPELVSQALAAPRASIRRPSHDERKLVSRGSRGDRRGLHWLQAPSELSATAFEVVSSRLLRSEPLANIVRQQVSAPAAVPSVDDILAALVEPPLAEPGDARYSASITRERRQQVRRGTDYLALEAGNRSLGAAGEEFVKRFEIARLIAERHERLAARVERVADTRGDGLGYDVLSFEASGQERLIEVKTTRYGPLTPFFVTRNEIAVSRESSAQFQLYRPLQLPSESEAVL